MLIDGTMLINRQLAARMQETVRFADGRQTTVTPVRYVPRQDDPEWRLDLDGEWAVVRWPFRRSEKVLSAPGTGDGRWERCPQPGPVFRGNPADTPSRVENWNRVDLSHVHSEDGALMRRTVRIPETWRGKRVYLHFDAIYPAARVYLNGELLGEHLSGLTPVEFDVSQKVRAGQSMVVAVRLLRKHAFVKLDMVRHAVEFAGLAQSAWFHACEPVHICDYQIIPELKRDLTESCLKGIVEIHNCSGVAETVELRTRLSGPDGMPCGLASRRVRVSAGERRPVEIALRVLRPRLWSDERPHLYTVTLGLKVRACREQTVSYRTAFRRLELSAAGARLNGRFVKFRGVNHLTFHPATGMHTPKDWLRRNLALMKKANVNAIRTHFLGPPALSELCDEMGFYLLQELPIDWGTHFIHDPLWMGPILMRLEGGVRRDRHHPSIVVWSVGNENMPYTKTVADDGWNHLRIADRFVKTLDPSRHTMFPPPGPANRIKGILEVRVGDVADIHYSFALIRDFNKTHKVTNPRAWDGTMETVTRAEALERGWSGVWFSSEYGAFNMQSDVMNAPYLSCISDTREEEHSTKNTLQVFYERLYREWGYMRQDPTCLGGAYFPWLCAGMSSGPEDNPWGWVRWGEDADWGVVTADLLPKPFFWALRVLYSPVWIQPDRVFWKQRQRKIEIAFSNQYNGIDLKDCTVRTMMGGGGKYRGQMREYRDVEVCCPPGETVVAKVPLWNEATRRALAQGAAAVCRITILDPRGFRPLTKDIQIVPEAQRESVQPMPIGPDAILD